MVTHPFPLAAPFSNTVITMEGKGNSREGKRLASFGHNLTFSRPLDVPVRQIRLR